jgi:hypothetical protein
MFNLVIQLDVVVPSGVIELDVVPACPFSHGGVVHDH